jgi:hypothetical protein
VGNGHSHNFFTPVNSRRDLIYCKFITDFRLDSFHLERLRPPEVI